MAHPSTPVARNVRLVATLGLALAALAGCRGEASSSARGPERLQAEQTRGARLFERHCAICHGSDGSGYGPGSYLLFPPPRAFNNGKFKLVSTTEGGPADADLVRTLRRGMPGTAMPSFGWLPQDDLAQLAHHVRALATEGLAHRLVQEASLAGGEELSLVDARGRAAERLEPGPVLRTSPPAESTGAVLEEGWRLYERSCVVCHGTDGKGRHDQPRWDDDGGLNWARDFTAGILKGGGTPEDLERRIRIGIPGTAMPATHLDDPQEAAALVAFVQGLLPPGAETRLVQVRERIEVHRIEPGHDEELDDPSSAIWESAPEVRVVLAPLWWHEDSVVEARLSGLHDGKTIALRLTWEDASRGDRLLSGASLRDAAALSFSTASAPPLFGMGSAEHPVNIWHWKAFETGDAAGLLDLLENPPHAEGLTHTGDVRVDAPVYVPALDEPHGSARSLTAQSHLHVQDAFPHGLEVRSEAQWSAGRWSVVFRRELEPRSLAEVPLRPDTRVQVACAIWNGAAGDRRGQKSITIWHELAIAP